MELSQQIQTLNRAQVIEAAASLSNILTNGEPDTDADELADSIKKNPSEHIEEIEELSRIILLNAAEEEEYQDLVKEVVSHAGRKQIILGGVEIVALAVVGVAALKIILNPLKKRKTTIKKADGSSEEIEEIHQESTGFLADVFKILYRR